MYAKVVFDFGKYKVLKTIYGQYTVLVKNLEFWGTSWSLEDAVEWVMENADSRTAWRAEKVLDRLRRAKQQ